MRDENLIARLRRQEPDALQDFYREYGPSILSVAFPIVGDTWDAEEVLQDVVWTVHRKIHTFEGRTEFWWWVCQITRNASRMLLRKRKRVPTPISQGEVEYLIETGDHPSVATPEQALALLRAERRLGDELRQMDPLNRQVFQAMDLKGQTKEEAAEDLGLSVEALKSRLHRVRKALRSTIQLEGLGEAFAPA